MYENIIIFGAARDFHAVDWYRVIKSLNFVKNVIFLTDNISGEGMPLLLKPTEKFESLLVIDKFLLSSQSKFANIWRNFLKLLLLPVQIFLLRRYVSRLPNSIVHAHPMYYMLLCWLSCVEYVGTPQGSELLVRCKKSKIYRLFAKHALSNAKYITVDSVQMANAVKLYSNCNAWIIQNGIDVSRIQEYSKNSTSRNFITSVRGGAPLYRIKEILMSRNEQCPSSSLKIVYPFKDDNYFISLLEFLKSDDDLLGRLEKDDLYKLLSNTLLTISIPTSDSSPRSVYEAIFAGSIVATVDNPWIASLPNSMQSRIIIVDINNNTWLVDAIRLAKSKIHHTFIPDTQAIEMLDQVQSLSEAASILYKL